MDKLTGSNRFNRFAQNEWYVAKSCAADIDDDGDVDLVAGNLGLNCDYTGQCRRTHAIICYRY